MSADPKFVHLRVHSDFSMVDGLAKVKPIIEHAKDLNMPAIALTDQMNLCGLVKYYGAAHGAGIKPIIGADMWVQSDELEDEQFRLTIIATNNEGYKNVTLLISRAYERGHVNGRATIDKKWLADHNEGLIVLSGGKDGDVGKALLKGNNPLAEQMAQFYQQHFADRYFLELVRTNRVDEEKYLHIAVEFSAYSNIPVVATNEVVFLSKENFEAHEIRVAIHDGYTLDDPRRPKRFSEEQYLRSEDEMLELFSDIPEALANSVEIAKRCNVTVRLGEYFLPNYPTGKLTIEEFLVKVSEEGLEERLDFLFPDEAEKKERRPEYDDRLKIELDIVNQMGFPGYFLIVMEFIQWSKDNDVPVGPGRGSGAGSLVAYALKITDLDPLEFDLLFERFLNPERVSMPDFDVDFCMDNRDKVIDHVSKLYGRDAVSQIITFGTMAAKAVVRDVGRVLGHPYGFVDRISKLIPPTPGMTLAKAFDEEPELPKIYKQDSDVKELIDMCRILEGCTRNAGKHAGGVVISPTIITDFAPLYCDDEGKQPVTQFDKNDVETAGLVKFDFLGLRTLTILKWAVDMANVKLAKAGKDLINIDAIPLDDKKSFDMLKRAETTAVFQLESSGMKALIGKLLPDCFEDIIALVALFRPGPLDSGMVDNFVERKHGREEVSYPDADYQHESLKPVLEPTYGIILYQEQVMQIAQVLAGYTLGGADMLRRAMGKKKPEEMAKQRSTFEEGAISIGVDGPLSMKIFDLVEKFAGYGFNKSHSAAYALVSFQTLWMKCHYPAEFMAAVMSADMDNTDKIVTLIDECERMKLPLNPPDVNTGEYKFTVNEAGEVVYGIGAIKGVGEGPVEAILHAREVHGQFKDIFDFCAKVDIKKINKRVLEKLVLSGAMDNLGPPKELGQGHRATLMATIADAIKAADQHAKAEQMGQSDLFGLLATEPEQVEQAFNYVAPWQDKVWLDGEQETLGLYLTGHPINVYLDEISHYSEQRIKSLLGMDAKFMRRDQSLTAVGLVVDVRVMVNKNGKKWALVTLDDKSGRLIVRLFPADYEKYQDVLQKDKILVASGQVSFDNFSDANTMTGREIIDIISAREKYLKCIKMSLHQKSIDEDFLREMKLSLQPFSQGATLIEIHYQREDSQAVIQLGTKWRVTPTDELVYELKQLSSDNVQLVF